MVCRVATTREDRSGLGRGNGARPAAGCQTGSIHTSSVRRGSSSTQRHASARGARSRSPRSAWSTCGSAPRLRVSRGTMWRRRHRVVPAGLAAGSCPYPLDHAMHESRESWDGAGDGRGSGGEGCAEVECRWSARPRVQWGPSAPRVNDPDGATLARIVLGGTRCHLSAAPYL
jgi:hypothetical protein